MLTQHFTSPFSPIALLAVTDAILQGMDRPESLLTQIELSHYVIIRHCFDDTDHRKLLMKRQQLQISTEWPCSYLEGHTQRVSVGTYYKILAPFGPLSATMCNVGVATNAL